MTPEQVRVIERLREAAAEHFQGDGDDEEYLKTALMAAAFVVYDRNGGVA